MLNDRGKIIIFVPAHQFLYSVFDKKIGHYRRYNISSLNAILPTELKNISYKYIDSIGFFASLANKFLLKSPTPSLKQVLFWDRYLIPLSRIFDRLMGFRFGKNIYAIIYR